MTLSKRTLANINHGQVKNIGTMTRKVRRQIFLAILASAVALFQPVEARTVEIPFENVAGLIVVQVRINRGPPAAFIVDTGANISLLSDRYVRDHQLALRPERAYLSGVGSARARKAALLQIDSVQVGSLVAHGQAAIVQDLGAFEAILKRPVAGVLGYPFLRRYRLTIDYERRALWLDTPGSS